MRYANRTSARWGRLPWIALPMRGSSQLHNANGGIDWQHAPENFAPIGRWRDWNWRQRRKFRHIAGREPEAMSY